MNNNIVNQNYWDYSYERYKYSIVNKMDPIRNFIEEYFTEKKWQSVIEIWCFPWRYLWVFWKLWYQLNWIDRTPRIKIDFEDFLNSEWFNIWEFTHWEFPSKNLKKYDIVYSIWFIEHFINFNEIIIEHAKLVKEHWYILLFTPNFAYGFQKWFHYNFDSVNTSRHVLESMNPDIWWEVLEKQGFHIICKWFYWGFDFWFDYQKRNFIIKYILYSLYAVKIITNKFWNLFWFTLFDLPNNKNYSPYCFALAKKK